MVKSSWVYRQLCHFRAGIEGVHIVPEARFRPRPLPLAWPSILSGVRAGVRARLQPADCRPPRARRQDKLRRSGSAICPCAGLLRRPAPLCPQRPPAALSTRRRARRMSRRAAGVGRRPSAREVSSCDCGIWSRELARDRVGAGRAAPRCAAGSRARAAVRFPPRTRSWCKAAHAGCHPSGPTPR